MHKSLRQLDNFALRVGHGVAWLTLALVVLTALVVLLRYALNQGSIALQETTLYIHGALFMLAMAYTLAMDEHVRVDIFYRNATPQRKALVDLLGTLLFLLPLCIAFLVLSWDYVLVSWARQEGSADAGGLPILYVLKTLLLVMPALLLVQALAELLRAALRLQGLEGTEAHPGEGHGWN